MEVREKIFPVVYVHLEGGASPWDTFMPLDSGAPKEFRGEGSTIPTSFGGGHRISSHFPQFAKIANQTSIIQSVDSQSSDHFTSTKNLLVQDSAVLGNRLGNHIPGVAVPYTFLNTEGQYQNDGPTLEDHHPNDSMRIDWNKKEKRFTAPTIKKDPRLLEKRKLLQRLDRHRFDDTVVKKMDEMQQRAFALLSGEGTYFDSFTVPQKDLERYGQVPGEKPNQLAHSAALANRLVQNGAGFVTIHDCEWQGWDMHNGEQTKNQLPVLAGHLDIALTQLIHDAREHGYLVICSSEFGRTPRVNGSGGRDHHSVHFAIGAGGHLKEDEVYGSYTNRGEVSDHKVTNRELGDMILAASGVKVEKKSPVIRKLVKS